MSNLIIAMIRYELLITMRAAYSWVTPLLFFIIVVCLFPLAIGPDIDLLNKIAPGIIWVAALLAIVISINQLFSQDREEGYLDELLLSSYPLTLLISCKLISHWIAHGFPLIIISPCLGFILNLSTHQEYALVMTLLIGTPTLVLLGAIGSALTVGIRHHGLLLPILIMPLYIPVLIFAIGAMTAASVNQPIVGYLAILGALFLITLAFSPLLTSISLRIGVNQC